MEKELLQLNERVTRLLRKCENKGHILSSLDISAITNISNAKTIKDVNYLAIQHFERLSERFS